MKIEVLGKGCAKCVSTMDNVNTALAELNREAEVVKVTDITDIVQRGILSTPALAIDGKVVMQGKLPTVDQIKQLIQAGA
jgi:small redox-active disulfide protein 2